MDHATRAPQAVDAERNARIHDQILAGGMEAAWQAYQSGRYGVGNGPPPPPGPDRPIVGASLQLAHALLRRGNGESVRHAVAIIESVLQTQERHPHHPHRGNWPRFVGDDEVEDLNSAPFILNWFLPLLLLHGHQLPSDLLARCRECVRLALEEVARLNVSVIYTNIHLMSTFALIVGAQWLEDAELARTGSERWNEWVRFTAQSGAPREYNCPGYAGSNLTVLAKLRAFAQDPAIRLQAHLLYERMWLHAAAHLHRPTRQLAGPHARCYWDAMVAGRSRVHDLLWRETGWEWTLESGPYGGEQASKPPRGVELALTSYWLPPFVGSWLEHQQAALPCEVRETASVTEGYDLTTYLAPSYALGTASRTYSTGTDVLAIEGMANHLLLHYARPQGTHANPVRAGTRQPGGWGMMYCRYVVNDRHWGELASFPQRSTTNFFDQGHFAAAQLRNRAIALYALRPLGDTYVSSLKTVVAFQSGDALERVWVNDQAVRVDERPRDLRDGDWLIVEDGAIYVGIRPLERSRLGRDAPILLERGPLGELWLSIYNYRGVPKRLWDYASLGGAFWRGNIRAGFVIEVADRAEYPSARAFLAYLQQATVQDTVDEAHLRTVSYRSGGDELVLRYDLWRTAPVERRLNGTIYQPPMLRSPLGAQGDSGQLQAGTATLTTNPQPVWLIAQELDPQQRTWIAANPEDRLTPLRLDTACGVITAERWGLGRLEWRAPVGGPQEVVIDALTEPEGLRVPPGVAVRSNVAGAS